MENGPYMLLVFSSIENACDRPWCEAEHDLQGWTLSEYSEKKNHGIQNLRKIM